MQKRFLELASGFLAEAGIECPVIPGEHIISVPLGDFSFLIGFLESREAVIMQAVVGIVPVSGREAFYAELLRMNSLFKGTGGTTLGIEGDAVTLQCVMHMVDFTQEAFNARGATFLEALCHMLENFSSIEERAASGTVEEISDLDIIAMQNMIRV